MEAEKFVKIWQCVQKMNAVKIFDYGIAICEKKGIQVHFENDAQKNRYTECFGNN